MTIPRGDIHVEVGSPPFDIFCRLNPSHEYLSLFGIERVGMYLAGGAGDDDGARKLDTRVVNETTIVARYEPGRRMRTDLVTCSMDVGGGQLRGVCNQNIYVGSELWKETVF